jgi:hypothetical protein
MVCACIHHYNDDNQVSTMAIGHQVGIDKSMISCTKIESYNQVTLIMSRDNKGFEFVHTDQKRPKLNDDQLTKFEEWIKKGFPTGD